jgi:hypothetical protein
LDGNANGGWFLNSVTYNGQNDTDSCSGSGSLSLGSPLGAYFNQCVTITGGQTYYMGFRFKPLTASDAGTVTCWMSFYDGTNCDGADSGYVDAAMEYNEASTWLSKAVSGTAPSGARRAKIHCSSAASSGYYDQFYLSRTPPGSPAF